MQILSEKIKTCCITNLMRNQIQDGTQEELLKAWLPESETSESAQIQGYKNLLRVCYVETQETFSRKSPEIIARMLYGNQPGRGCRYKQEMQVERGG